MKAYVLSEFGPAENLRLTEVETPVPGDGEVLVRVRATSVNPYDWHHMRGEPVVARYLDKGLGRRPNRSVLGCDLAGEIAAVGPGVTGWRPGDEVYALVR